MPLVGCLRIFASFHVNFYSSKKGGGLSTGNCNGFHSMKVSMLLGVLPPTLHNKYIIVVSYY